MPQSFAMAFGLAALLCVVAALGLMCPGAEESSAKKMIGCIGYIDLEHLRTNPIY